MQDKRHWWVSVPHVLLLCLALTSGSVKAATLTVQCDGAEGAVYSSIQDAIDAAVPGDTVVVAPGVCSECVNFHGKDIILTAQSPDLRDVTILDGDGVCRPITLASGETNAATIRDLTIRNGLAGRPVKGPGEDFRDSMIGGCVLLENASATITGNRFENCIAEAIASDDVAAAQGGAIGMFPGVRDFVIEDNEFIGNRAVGEPDGDPWAMGGALAVSGGDDEDITGIIRGNRFTGNWVDAGDQGHAGAVGIWHAEVLFEDNVLVDNEGPQGGAMLIEHSGGTFANNLFAGNSGEYGGALDIPGGCPTPREIVLEDNVIESNFARIGGGIRVSGVADPLSIIHNTIVGNIVSYADDQTWSGGGGLTLSGTDAYVGGNEISYNSAFGADSPGGGVLFWQSESVFEHNILVENHSDWAGGAVLVEQADPLIVQNRFIRNTVGASGNPGHGGGAVGLVDTNAAVTRNLFWGNHAYGEGHAIQIETLNLDTSVRLVANLFSGTTSDGGVITFGRPGDHLLETQISSNVFAHNAGYCVIEEPGAVVQLERNRFVDNVYLYYDADTGQSITSASDLNHLPEATHNTGRAGNARRLPPTTPR